MRGTGSRKSRFHPPPAFSVIQYTDLRFSEDCITVLVVTVNEPCTTMPALEISAEVTANSKVPTPTKSVGMVMGVLCSPSIKFAMEAGSTSPQHGSSAPKVPASAVNTKVPSRFIWGFKVMGPQKSISGSDQQST